MRMIIYIPILILCSSFAFADESNALCNWKIIENEMFSSLLSKIKRVKTVEKCIKKCKETEGCERINWRKKVCELHGTNFKRKSNAYTATCEYASTTKSNALIISGGLLRGSDGGVSSALDSVELVRLNEDTGEVESTCELPSLPDIRGSHTMVTNTICGGFTGQEGLDTCINLSEGQWTQTHTLQSPRYAHSAWEIPDGVVLLGGSGGPLQADLVKTSGDSSTELIFNLKYSSSGSCTISDADSFSVIVTGGQENSEGIDQVTRYSKWGFVEDLPGMLSPRFNHGCGSYKIDESLVFLVTGGMMGSLEYYDSTEIYQNGQWTEAAKLPWAVTGLRGMTLDNSVIMTGGYDNNGNERDEVLRFDPNTSIWTEIGKLASARYYHAVGVVTWEEYGQYCQTRKSSQAEKLPSKIADTLNSANSLNISKTFF